MTNGEPIIISAPTLSRDGDVSRVEAIVDGVPTWFESADAELSPRVEAFATAFLGPALALGRRLHVKTPVDHRWFSNVQNILPIWQRWWDYNLTDPILAQPSHDTDVSDTRTGKPLIASCFTGGADSFYTLLRGPNSSSINRLLFIHGYDIPLADTTRMDAWNTALRRVAKAVGKPAIVIRTNLRLHPLFRNSNWERTHGGALAGAGHTLANAGQLIVPSSYTLRDGARWGSHIETDEFWSGSARQVVHDDATVDRRAKLRAIANEPLTWDSLRVCWEGRTATGNCSMCEKCVRTMLSLSVTGRLEKFTVFDQTVPLADRVASLGRLPTHLTYVYESLLKEGVTGAPARAIRRLLATSRPPGLVKRAVRKAKRVLLKLSPRP